MRAGKFVLHEILEQVPHWELRRLVQRQGLDSGRLKFTRREHFLVMSFANLMFRESFRDIEAYLSALVDVACYLGCRSRVSRSLLVDASEQRDWRLFADLAQRLMTRARRRDQHEPNPLEMDATIYTLDASLIDLSLALCPWANWTGTDAAIKLLTLLDLRGPLPAFVSGTFRIQSAMRSPRASARRFKRPEPMRVDSVASKATAPEHIFPRQTRPEARHQRSPS